MTNRIHNFGAGPAVLPEAVLEQARAHLLALPGVGMSVLEISHRSKAFDEILAAAEANIRALAGVSDDYHVLFLQGGATLQFSMVPMNLLPRGESDVADYVLTGSWAQQAAAEAEKFGTVRIAGTTQPDGYRRVPAQDELTLSGKASYVHLTTNNTIVGTQWRAIPETGEVPLVVDASSDIFSRPLEIGKHGLVYAGAQKNLGPAGVTVVIIRRDLAERGPASLPKLLRYATHVKGGSRANTPPVFAIYLVSLVTAWLRGQGGLDAMAERNARKAEMLYAAIDRTGFYRGVAEPGHRSLMNVTFRLSDEGLESRFAAEADTAGLAGLKGHRSVGGLRASLYNACPVESVEALVDFMAEFERRHG